MRRYSESRNRKSITFAAAESTPKQTFKRKRLSRNEVAEFMGDNLNKTAIAVMIG